MLGVWIEGDRKTNVVLDWVFKKINTNELSLKKKDEIRKKIQNLLAYVSAKLSKCNRMVNRFKEKYPQWVSATTIIEISENDFEKPCSSKAGRPNVSYTNAKYRLKRKLASDLSCENNDDVDFLIHAATVAAKKSKQSDLAFILKKTAQQADQSEIRKAVTSKKPEAVPLTPEEALAFLLENDLSKRQYINMRLLNKERNCNIYPSYEEVIKCKLLCRPKEISVSESLAEVSLQNLLDHTAQRILLFQKDVLHVMADISNVVLIASYGFDGTTGQSMFKQRFETSTPQLFDQSLFVTTIIPLQMLDSSGKIIWRNRTTQSVRFCRPLKMQFAKESTDLILSENSQLDMQISYLNPFEYYLDNGEKIIVNYDLHMTLIDGKVLNVITNTNSNQKCPICGATPKQFLTTKNFNSDVFKPKPTSLRYGISPLHAWIRVFEFVVHIAYRIGLKKWQIREASDKKAFQLRKQEVQKRFWEEMGLHVDKPKANGSGTSNDGNTARKAFKNLELFSSITNIDIEVLNNFRVILIAISCEYPIDTTKFEDFCKRTAFLYMEKYLWFPMSATVHKILVHGSQIIKNSVIPVGCFGENASEARNKLYKRDRIAHARKDTRKNNMTDVFNRAMDSSDPLISSLSLSAREKYRKREKLPEEVIQLLAPSSELQIFNHLPGGSEYDSDNFDSDISEADDAENALVLDTEGCDFE